jgi:hypothetical protein
MLSDMTDEIVAETSAELHANQREIAAPVVHIEVLAAPAASK